MRISPPIGVSAIAAVALAVAAGLAPPQHAPKHVSVMLPTATYEKLAMWGQEHADEDGRPLTVVQVVEKLAINRATDETAPLDRSGIRGM